jgi:ring-1,2-phenylacetyl-CoA epoxidase subunit PaaE
LSFGILESMEGERRRGGRFDAVAALVARSLPKSLTPRVEQVRLDLKMVGGRISGRAPSAVIGDASASVPLSEIDPLDALPRGLADRIRAARRDVGMLHSRLIRGQTPSPTIERRQAPEGNVVSLPRKAPKMTRPLKVVGVERETEDAVSIYLTEADGSPVMFEPGQFLSIDVVVNGERLRRAYSLASACRPDVARHITVKRVEGGRASNHLNDTVAEGQELAVLGPSGSFTVEPRPVNRRHLVMIAGGSGITPIMSILETVLRVESASRVTLIYGNRDWDHVIFRERLDSLSKELGERLVVDHVLENPPEWWTGERGLLSSGVIESRLRALGIVDDGLQRYFVCGPTPMMEAAHATLAARGVPSSRVAEERFTSPESRAEARGSDKTELVTIVRGGREHGVQVEAGQTILEAALAAKIDAPFSCAMGGCGACRVQLTAGEVQMEEPNCLSRNEREQGYVLMCVGRPLGPCTIEVEGT